MKKLIIKKLIMSLFLMGLINTVQAKDFGTFGETFSIEEPDFIQSLMTKLSQLEQEGVLLQHQHKIQAQVAHQIQHPESVKGLIKTKKPRVFYYDPSLKVPYDLKDHQGQVFMKAGTIINPLETHALKQPLLLIEGRDTAQLAWALQENPSKIILVNGAPLQLMEKHQKRFYFDQGGVLSKKFGLQQVPARITQAEKMLCVEELLLPDEGQTVRHNS